MHTEPQFLSLLLFYIAFAIGRTHLSEEILFLKEVCIFEDNFNEVHEEEVEIISSLGGVHYALRIYMRIEYREFFQN